MNNLITKHPRTILAGALSAALMFATGGVMAQETTQDRDTTTQQGENQDQTSGQDGSAQGTAQHTERDREWYQTMDQQVEESQDGIAQDQRSQAQDHIGHDRIQTSRDLSQADRDDDRDRAMAERDGDIDGDVDGGLFDRDSDQPINDTWITTKVKSSLLADSDVAGTEVSVETINGVVHLSGYVDDQRQIDRAVEVARDIEGVTRVESSGLQLKTSDTD